MNPEIIHGDGLEIARGLSDASIDALITDPPYCAGGISESSRAAAGGQGLRSENLRRFGWFTGDNMTTAGLTWLLRAIAFESCRFLKPTGSALVFMDWRMAPHLIAAIESSGLRYQGLVVWDKGCMGLGTGFRATHELIAHFTNGSPRYYDKSKGNVLRHTRVGAKNRQHQTEKPVGLLSDLLGVVCPPGGTVFDPFAGSGTTGAAAIQTGRHAILAERELAHVETMRQRLTSKPEPWEALFA